MDAVSKLINTPIGRRKLAELNPSFFATYYMGFEYADHQANWLLKVEELSKRAAKNNTKEKLLILAPRDHGKSYLSVIHTIRSLCLDRNKKILWVSASTSQAEKRVKMCRGFFESQRIVEDFAAEKPFFGKDSKSIATQIYLSREVNTIDPSIEAVGIGGSITGAHVDIIIMDDCEDNNTCFSAAGRQKNREWFSGTLAPMLSRGGILICLGTRKHYDDIYAYFLKDPTFTVVHDKAIIEEPEKINFIKEVDTQGRERIIDVEVVGGKCLWPEKRPLSLLVMERNSAGSLMFTREFQNEVQDDSATLFKSSWLQDAKEKGKDLSYGYIPGYLSADSTICQGWDLSLLVDEKAAKKGDTDYTVGMTILKDNQGNRYVIGLYRNRGITPKQLVSDVIIEYMKFCKDGFGVKKIGVEKNTFGALHLLNLQENTDLPFKPIQTTQNTKAQAIPALASLFENGKVYLPYKTKEDQNLTDILIQELYEFGKAKHDDTVMALIHCETALKDSSFQYTVSTDEKTTYSIDGEVINEYTEEQYRKDAEAEHLKILWNELPGLENLFDID